MRPSELRFINLTGYSLIKFTAFYNQEGNRRFVLFVDVHRFVAVRQQFTDMPGFGVSYFLISTSL